MNKMIVDADGIEFRVERLKKGEISLWVSGNDEPFYLSDVTAALLGMALVGCAQEEENK